MVQVPDLTNRRSTVLVDAPHLSRRQLDRSVGAFLGHELGGSTCAADELSTFPDLQLDVVDHRPERDVTQGEGIPGLDVSLLAGRDDVSHVEPNRSENIPLLSVPIMQQSDAGRTVRIILDRRHLGGHSILLPAKVNDTVPLLVPAPTMKTGLPATIVAATTFVQGRQQRALGRFFTNLAEVQHALKTSSSRGRFVLSQSHTSDSFKEVDAAAGRQGNVRLLPGWPPASGFAYAPLFAQILHRVDPGHLDLKQRLDRVFNGELVGVRTNTEDDLIPGLIHQGRFLRDQGRSNHRVHVSAHAPNLSLTCSSASCVKSTWR